MTTTTQDLMGPEDAIKALIEICEAEPNHRNPRNGDQSGRRGGTCVYQSPTDPDDNCLIGRLARREGWQVPGPGFIGSARAAANKFEWPITEAAKLALTWAQRQADDRSGFDGAPRLWGEIVPKLRETLEDRMWLR